MTELETAIEVVLDQYNGGAPYGAYCLRVDFKRSLDTIIAAAIQSQPNKPRPRVVERIEALEEQIKGINIARFNALEVGGVINDRNLMRISNRVDELCNRISSLEFSN